MEPVDNVLLETRAERIARYKAERRRELAERFGSADELSSKWGRRAGEEPDAVAGATGAVNGKVRHVANGYEEDSASLRSPDSGPGTSSLDLAVTSGAEVRRRTRRYLPGAPGGGRKTGERFRTQPITANEMQESSGLVEADEEENTKADVKTDDRAKMSVAAKMSLFKRAARRTHHLGRNIKLITCSRPVLPELEKTATPESSAFLKPRSGSLCHERRSRHGNEHRFLTQPITCEEMVAIREPQPTAPASPPDQLATEPQEEDESCRLSMSEKLALFNSLSLPGAGCQGPPTEGPPERRRQKGARYRTQPITVEEVSLLQKGPVQLPAFCLAPHLSDRQQALSVNLKPSELRLSTPDIGPASTVVAEPGPGPQHHSPLSRSESEPAIRGILKKSRSSTGVAWRTDPAGGPTRTGQNRDTGMEDTGARQQQEAKEEQQEEEEELKRQEAPPPLPPRRQRSRASAAPWRQRDATETGAAHRSSERHPTDSPGLPQEDKGQQEEGWPSRSNAAGRHGEEEEEEERRSKDKSNPPGVTLAEGSTLRPQVEPTCDTKEENDNSTFHHETDHHLCWDPVFASVYSSSTPQYVMCFNQSNLSFEAQEVTSPTQVEPQPQCRQKVEGGTAEEEPPLQREEEEEEEEEEAPSMSTQREAEERASIGESKESEKSTPLTAASRSTKRDLGSPEPDSALQNKRPSAMTCPSQEQWGPGPSQTGGPSEGPGGASPSVDRQEADGCFYGDGSPPSACVPLQPDGGAATDTQQDLGVFCQTSTPILSSAVTEHRRAVRPSRRSQGSRNPLRALAAREDINQDHMGDHGDLNGATEESASAQAHKKAKNSNSRQNSRENVVSSDAVPDGGPAPFNSPMLLQIKGSRQVQTRLVEPSAASLNSGDCFLLVTKEHCVLWSGEHANDAERVKALEFSSHVQSHGDLGCQAPQVLHLEEGLGADSSLAADFWSLLGGRRPYRGAGPPGEDELYERGVVESNCVYRLQENRLVPQDQAWAAVPSVSLLGPAEALVFDFGSEVYLWHGDDVPPASRQVALHLAGLVRGGAYDYSNCRVNPLDPSGSNPSIQLRGEGRPAWALFGVVSQHRETALFREKFRDWVDSAVRAEEPGPLPDSPVGGTGLKENSSSAPSATLTATAQSEDTWVPCDAKALLSGQGPALDPRTNTGPPGAVALEGGGRWAELETVAVETWQVQDGSEVSVESNGRLHEGETYAVRWTYTTGKASSPEDLDRKEKTVLFLWHGRHSSVSGRDPASFLSIGRRSEEDSEVVVVLQGQEPPSFLRLFSGGLVTHRGRRDPTPPAHTGGWCLFCLRGQLPDEGSLLEVESCCSGLRSRGSVVLLNDQQGSLFLWHGCKAHASSREVGRRAVDCLAKSSQNPLKVTVVEEGSEPAEFWSALGGQDRKAYDCMLQDPGKYSFTPRLFHMGIHGGAFRGEEIQSPARLPGVVMAMPFVQERLCSAPRPALFLLDNRLEVYLWQGGPAAAAGSGAAACSRWANERRCAMQTVLQYCRELNPRRPPRAYLISEGTEPLTFTNVFPHWERARPSTQGDRGQAKLVLVQDALDQLLTDDNPAKELARGPLPDGTDPQSQEVYMSDQDFQAVLEEKREEVTSVTAWSPEDVQTTKGLYV